LIPWIPQEILQVYLLLLYTTYLANKVAAREEIEGTTQSSEDDDGVDSAISLGGKAPRAAATTGEKPSPSTVTMMKFKDGEEEWEIKVTERVVGDWYRLEEDGRAPYKCSHLVFMRWMKEATELVGREF